MIARRMGDRGDKASGSAAPVTHPLQQRVKREPPPDPPTARHFFIREIGILAEQGVLDRARTLLTRRARDAPDEPEAYLDAMRFELCVPSSGHAWSAWMGRAIDAAVPVATYIATIVPERTLAPALLEVAASALLEQADRKNALDLLRLRAVAGLTAGDGRALDLLDAEVLKHAALDGELAELCLHVLSARAFADPDHVERLAIDFDAACSRPNGDPVRAELRAAIALGRSYRSLAIDAPCPAPLERALGLLGRCDPAADRALLADLARDLRAQPASYLAWADAVASTAPALIDGWLAQFRGLGVGESAAEPVAASPRSDALVLDMTAAIESNALRFLPLQPAEQALYRKHVRRKALSAILEPGLAAQLRALIASAAQQAGRAKRVLALLGSDPALALIDQLAITSASRGSGPETTAHR
jgi:hypothetical protein